MRHAGPGELARRLLDQLAAVRQHGGAAALGGSAVHHVREHDGFAAAGGELVQHGAIAEAVAVAQAVDVGDLIVAQDQSVAHFSTTWPARIASWPVTLPSWPDMP